MENIQSAQVVLSCGDLAATMEFFRGRLGFRLERISPADNPRSALLTGYGLRLLLRLGEGTSPEVLQLVCDDPAPMGGVEGDLIAPNGTRIELVSQDAEVAIPEGRQELVVTRQDARSNWITGRAGMRYRDLIPNRLGGLFIASHIQIVEGGPVPDNVHFHALRFQMIFCLRGWVRLVYEDQGQPFLLRAGDCVLQPPRIRHRVLESSAGLEVVELACPAEHDTFLDHELTLPTAVLRKEREFGGQRFLHHQASKTPWKSCSMAGFEARDSGMAGASCELAGARVLRSTGQTQPAQAWGHSGEFLFAYVLAGSMTIEPEGRPAISLQRDACLVLPRDLSCTLTADTDDLEFLEVRLPGAPR